MVDVILSDGEPASLKILLPWAFDDLREEYLSGYEGPFYRFKARQPSGHEVDDFIDTSEMAGPPAEPDQAAEKEPAAWVEYRYQSDAWDWKQRQRRQFVAYEQARRQRIIDSQPAEIRARIKTAGDRAIVITAAPVPEVKLSDIARAAELRFRFRFDDLGLIGAMEKYGLIKDGEPSRDGYDLCRCWEFDVMREWRLSQDEYAALPLEERAALVWATVREGIWQGLKMERDRMNRGR